MDTCPTLQVAIQMVLDRIRHFPTWHYHYAPITPIWSLYCFYLGGLSHLSQCTEELRRPLDLDILESVLRHLKGYSKHWKLSCKLNLLSDFSRIFLITPLLLTTTKIIFIIIFINNSAPLKCKYNFIVRIILFPGDPISARKRILYFALTLFNNSSNPWRISPL